MQVLNKSGNNTKKSNLKGMLLRQIAGVNANDKTSLMFKAVKRIHSLLDSKDSEDWNIGLNNFNKLLPYCISKESYDKPLLSLVPGSGGDGDTKVYIQLNNFIDGRDDRKDEVSKLDTSKEIQGSD